MKNFELMFMCALSALVTFLISCDVQETHCDNDHRMCTDAAPQNPNREHNNEKDLNNNESNDLNAKDAEPSADNEIPLEAHKLECAIDRNQAHYAFAMLHDNAEIVPQPLNAWQEDSNACNSYNVKRTSGYEYTIVVIPPLNREASLNEWLTHAHIGNQTPAKEAITPYREKLAYLYTSTDLGAPKIYAVLWTGAVILYIEWHFPADLSPEQLMIKAREEHLIFAIPDDLRELIHRII